MANAILTYQNQAIVIANIWLKQKILRQNFSNISLERTHGPFLNCCMGRNWHSKRRKFKSGQLKNHTYRWMNQLCPWGWLVTAQQRFLGLVSHYHFDRITRSKEQKVHLYQAVTKLRSRLKKIGEKKGLSNGLVKKRVYGSRKDLFFYLYSDAQYSLKFLARIVPTPLFLPIYVIMTSFPLKLTKFFSFIDFYFIHFRFSYGWIWISKLGSVNEWDMGNLQMHLQRHKIMTSQSRNKNVTKIVKN